MDGSSTLVMCCGCDAASQDTPYGAPVEVAEYPGVHAEPLQPAVEDEPLSGRFRAVVCPCDSIHDKTQSTQNRFFELRPKSSHSSKLP